MPVVSLVILSSMPASGSAVDLWPCPGGHGFETRRVKILLEDD